MSGVWRQKLEEQGFKVILGTNISFIVNLLQPEEIVSVRVMDTGWPMGVSVGSCLNLAK